jgi:hypothetical protein
MAGRSSRSSIVWKVGARWIRSIASRCPRELRGCLLGRGKLPRRDLEGEGRANEGRRFNKIGNREMYMNCAVVDVVPKGSLRGGTTQPPTVNTRDATRANAAAQAALSSYPPLFVANLKSVKDCITKETMDVVFDDPGKTVAFAHGENASAKPSFGSGQCTGRGAMTLEALPLRRLLHRRTHLGVRAQVIIHQPQHYSNRSQKPPLQQSSKPQKTSPPATPPPLK